MNVVLGRSRSHLLRGSSSEASVNVPRDTLGSLTGVRFVAAMGVFLFHFGAASSQRAGAPHALTTFLSNGNMGVSFFFTLSGFILTYTYEGRILGIRDAARFLYARFARLYPVYILALLLAAPVLTRPLTLGEGIKVLLMVQSWTSFTDTTPNAWVSAAWTLSIEMFFYLIFPILLAGVLRLSARQAIAVGSLLAVVVCALAVPEYAPGVKDPLPIWSALGAPLPLLRATEFALGMCAARVYLLATLASLHVLSGWKTTLTAAAIVLILASTHRPQIVSIATVFFPLLLLQLAEGSGALSKLLGSRILILLGGASYSLYMLHGTVREWARVWLHAPFDALLTPFAAVALSIATYLLWERPAQRWLMTNNPWRGREASASAKGVAA